MPVRPSSSPLARLLAYALVLAVALAGGAAVGRAWGPAPSADPAPADHDAPDDHAAPGDVGPPAGLALSQDGYSLELLTPMVAAGEPAELALRILGPDGAPVTEYDVEHDKELHLVVVGRDLRGYAHVHPARDSDGTWTVATPALAPGSYRAYADFVPAGGDNLTLGADLVVPGAPAPAAPVASDRAEVDGYEVTFDGELVAGRESVVTVTVGRNGEPVTDLQPYLGALGHLVAVREGDMAYLHVHPLADAERPGGPTVEFAVEVPTAGTYALFLDFAHDDGVRTASVVTTAGAGGTGDEAAGHGPMEVDDE